MKNLLTFLLVVVALCSRGKDCIGNVILPVDDPKSPIQIPQPKCYEEIIDTCFFTTYEDCDDDGYANWRWLVVDMKGEAPSGEAFLEVWLTCGDEYYLLASTDIFTFPRTRYSLKVNGSKHLKGNVVVIMKDTGIGEDVDYFHLKESVKIESAAEDLKIELAYCQWSNFDFVDGDGDGYYSQHRLNVNVNSCPFSTPVYFKVSACKQPLAAGPCWYYISPVYNTEPAGEILYMIFGGENGDLLHGEYQIDLQVFDANTDAPITDMHTIDHHMKFELPEEDGLPPDTFSINNVFFGDYQIDMDLDDYNLYRNLKFNASVSSGTFELTARIFFKNTTEVDFQSYDSFTTKPFTVSGSAETGQEVIIGIDCKELPHNSYDFKIQLLLGTAVVAEKLPADDRDLNAQLFETTLEDAPFKINSVQWSLMKDWDGDGYPSYRELKVGFDTYAEPVPVYIELSGWLGENEVSVFTSGVFTPADNASDTTFIIVANKFFHGKGTVFLYNALNNKLINAIPSVDLMFESPEKDMIYSISSTAWSDSVDYDLDGYCSSRKFKANIFTAPLQRTLKLEVSMCKQPILAGPCTYISDYYFKADSTDDDIFSIALGSPNAELDSGKYQFDFWIIDSITDEKVIGIILADGNLKMESVPEDPYKFTIKEVYHKDWVDMDGDSYNAVSNLFFDVNVTGGDHAVYAKLLYRPEGIPEYTEYYTTTTFEVTPGINSYEKITIGFPNSQLDYGVYDFKLVVLDADSDEQLAESDPETERDLNDQHYETFEQDAPQKIVEGLNNDYISSYSKINHVFPNPFDNAISITFGEQETDETCLVRLIDSRGVLVLEQKVDHSLYQARTIEIDKLENLRPGIYILEILSPGAIGQMLVIKR